MMKQVIDSGHVDPRSYIGQKFAMTHKPASEKGQDYRKLNRDQAAEYRLQWVQKEYAMTQEKRSFVETWRRVDVTKGRKMTLSKMSRDEGHDVESIIGCLKTAYKCSLMGFPWCGIHPQSEGMEYMKLEFGFEETFEQCWSIYKTEFNDLINLTGRPAASEQPGGEKAAAIQQPGEVVEINNKASPKEKHSPRVKTAEEKHVQEVIKNATAMKSQSLARVSEALGILASIDEDPSWAWARNEQNKGRLQRVLDEFRSSFTPFGKQIMVQKLSELKKQHGSQLLHVELITFMDSKQRLDKLTSEVDKILRRHNVK